MLAAVLLVLLSGPPEPVEAEPTTEVESTPAVPPPTLVPEQPSERPRRIRRCLPEVEPCYRTTSARLLLASSGVIAAAAAVAIIFEVGDRWRVGDPSVAIVGGGVIAISGAAVGGIAALLRGDGAAIPDRITPATIGLGFGYAGTNVAGESVASSMSASIAPTLTFPRDLGRLRVLGRFGGDLGDTVEVDPGSNPEGGPFSESIRRHTAMRFDAGLDLALRLPYPIGARSPWLGQFELRYKPLFFGTREYLQVPDLDTRVSQRLALTPLNFGFRWHLSPRQRFTFYVGPRWDRIDYGDTATGLGKGDFESAPMYGETWFDLDVPLQRTGRSRRAIAVGQVTLGYVHSRLGVEGINLGSVVGFLGHTVTQFAVRVRPRGSRVGYQLELGARVGAELSPYLRVGVVLPDIGVRR
ncbi:MAG TPA: hypothetical protein VK034_03285 [Enhygromyxa sp.]|nr:hypothetical protein [Enhygromyxa sp.]